jgi:hypothetical protein
LSGDGRGGDDGGGDAGAGCRRGGAGREQAAGAAVVEGAAGEVGAEWLGGKEGENVLLFCGCDEVEDEIYARNFGGYTAWDGGRGG